MSLLLDWDTDAIIRKYSGTYCTMEIDGNKSLVYVTEPASMGSEQPSLLYIHSPQLQSDGRWTDGPGVHGGAIHTHSSGNLKVNGSPVPTGHLQGLSRKAKYFVCGFNALYFGARKLHKTFKWGIDKDSWHITRAAAANVYTVPTIVEFVMAQFTSRKEHAEYKLLSEEVAVIGGVIKILGVTVGFLDGTQAKVKNAAVGKILSELEPSWTISYW
jgi:hypothetical protein